MINGFDIAEEDINLRALGIKSITKERALAVLHQCYNPTFAPNLTK
jgi:hypothetical protein